MFNADAADDIDDVDVDSEDENDNDAWDEGIGHDLGDAEKLMIM